MEHKTRRMEGPKASDSFTLEYLFQTQPFGSVFLCNWNMKYYRNSFIYNWSFALRSSAHNQWIMLIRVECGNYSAEHCKEPQVVLWLASPSERTETSSQRKLTIAENRFLFLSLWGMRTNVYIYDRDIGTHLKGSRSWFFYVRDQLISFINMPVGLQKFS